MGGPGGSAGTCSGTCALEHCAEISMSEGYADSDDTDDESVTFQDKESG